MNKLSILLPASIIFAGCTIPILNITIPIGEQTTEQSNQQAAATLAQIMETGGEADCTVTKLADNSTTRMIISGKKMKIVGSDMGEGKMGTMINDGTYAWVWTEGETTGFKTRMNQGVTPAVTGAEEQTPDVQETAAGYEDETKYKLSCTQKTIGDSEFVPPANVSFTDTEQMMKDAGQQMNEAMPSGIPSLPANISTVPAEITY